MKAPDTLWVAAQWHPQEKKMGLYAFASAEETSHPDKEQYIRKDALLEWLEEMAITFAEPEIAETYESVIVKIKSL